MSEDTAFEVGRLYKPIKAIADTLVASQKDIFVRLPGLVAYWPMGIRFAGNAVEHGGAGFNLAQTGVCPTGYDGNSFAHIGNGTNFFWSSSSQLAVSGTETWISSSIRGLTLGGWFMADSTPTTNSGLITKDKDAPERGYGLLYTSSDEVQFFASGTGAATVLATSAEVGTGSWRFMVGRFIPSTEVAVFVDGDKVVNSTAIPAAVNGSAQDFEVGRYFNDNNRIVHGKSRDVFICASSLSDALIEEVRATSVP